MNMQVYWSIVGGLALLAFAVGESYALKTGAMTLSVYLRQLSSTFPPFIFMAGALAGHLWWSGMILGK